MSSLDDWSPPVSPSIIAAMEMDVVPDTCPSQVPETQLDDLPLPHVPMTEDTAIDNSPSKLSDIGDLYNGPENDLLEDLPVISSTQIDDLNDMNDGQASPLTLMETDIVIPDSSVVKEQREIMSVDYKPVPFCCKKWKHLSADRIKACQRFLDDPAAMLVANETIEIFSELVVFDTFPDKITSLFCSLKQTVSRINQGLSETDVEFFNSRKEVVLFYSFLKRFILRLPKDLSSEAENVLQTLVNQIHSVVMYVDRLTDMKFDVMLSTSPCDYNRYHLNFDLYWNTLELMYLLEDRYKDPFPLKKISSSITDVEDESRSLLSQMVQIVLWELVAIAINKFQKSQDLLHSSPFECSCVKDMWKQLACLLNHKGETFWICLHEVFQVLLNTEIKVPDELEMDSDVYMYPPVDNITLNDNSKFCMWLLTNVALLVNSSEQKVVPASNYYDLNFVSKKVLSKGDVSESDLRFYIKYCLQVNSVWEPNINLLVIFWDYFYKRMNSTFQMKTVSIDSLQTVSKTAVDFLERCKGYCRQKLKNKNETSFQLYLSLMGNHLRKLVDTSSMQEWKQMKGRIYSKFHLRRIQELTETGLNNFTNLFLCLALTADLEDVGTKLCGFYEMVEVNRQNIGKLEMIWKGMFALMLLYLEKDVDVKLIANKVTSAFSNICLEFEVFDSDPGFRHGLWKLINVYLDGVQEIFDTSVNLGLSQHILIGQVAASDLNNQELIMKSFTGEGYAKLLKVCRNNEVPTILTGMQDIIGKIRSTLTFEKKDYCTTNGENQHYIHEFYEAVMTNIYPSIRELCQSQTAQVQLADILAEISLLAIHCKPDDYFVIVKLILQSEAVNKNIVCRYLSNIVTIDMALDLLSGHMSNFQTVLIQTWIRCAVFVPASSKQLQALSRSVLSLPEIKSILNGTSYVIPQEPDKIIYHVFKAIQNLYDKLENWKEKIQLRDQVTEYVRDIHRHLTPYFQTMRPVETLCTAYSVVGYLVKCCGHLLYVKSKPNCPLPDIINTMVVPHTLFKKDKPTSPVFLGLVRDHLHLFVSGLSNLDFRRDPFIQRRLKDIVTIYLPKFWNSAGSTSSLVHPLVTSLKGSYVRQPSESSQSFRQYMLEIVKDNFMTVTQTYNLPENYQMALYFIRDVMNRTGNKEVLASDLNTLVFPMLSIHLQCESISTQQLCTTILQQMVDAGSSHQNIATRELIGEQIMQFITKFKKIKLNQAIKTLEKLPRSGSCYVQKALPRIEHIIVEFESFKGTGQDQRLRQTYASLVQALQT